ncbi:MAG: cytidylate kinase-like family protein [Synergistaceae bacterium]|nr:cytidylate kinase-like family protein [Synergistaceae bacterium]
MKLYTVTIAREYGSGGRLIGKQLADELGIAFYDRELISYAASDIGLDEEFIKSIEQKKSSGFLYNLYSPFQWIPINEQVFLAQSNVIKNIAERESSVIIGRCADYVLENMRNCIRFFIYAPIEFRLSLVKDVYQEGESGRLEDYIRKQDKGRASYYNFFTQQKWGRAQNYHLCLNSSIGIQSSVRLLKKFVEEFNKEGV